MTSPVGTDGVNDIVMCQDTACGPIKVLAAVIAMKVSLSAVGICCQFGNPPEHPAIVSVVPPVTNIASPPVPLNLVQPTLSEEPGPAPAPTTVQAIGATSVYVGFRAHLPNLFHN